MEHSYETSDCPKCMSVVMRLLAASTNRGCPAANATVVANTAGGRVPTSFCETLLPKKRACVAYSFGLEGTWDFDKAMVAKGCRVLSFDPMCCGASAAKLRCIESAPVGSTP